MPAMATTKTTLWSAQPARDSSPLVVSGKLLRDRLASHGFALVSQIAFERFPSQAQRCPARSYFSLAPMAFEMLLSPGSCKYFFDLSQGRGFDQVEVETGLLGASPVLL